MAERIGRNGERRGSVWRIAAWGLAGLILLLPLVAMQFTDEVEWTASDFVPYPGFAPDPYADYSEPWFRTHRVLRGGCHATQPRLIRAAYRNFYTPDRRDVFAGFRTAES